METISAQSAVAAILDRRLPGPVKPPASHRGIYATGERAQIDLIDRRARFYMAQRARGTPAAQALANAQAARGDNARQWPQYYGSTGGAGEAFESAGTRLRWIESTDSAGFRFVAWADELLGGRVASGYFTDGFQESYLRGGVWQLSARKGVGRLVYGYAEWEGRGETNPGSAALALFDIETETGAREWEATSDWPAAREAARFADGLAERAAEKARDYAESYDAGRQTAELEGEQLEAGRVARELAKEIKGLAAQLAGRPAICATLRGRLRSILCERQEARDKRDELARNRPSGAWQDTLREAWESGFADNSGETVTPFMKRESLA